LFLLKLAGVFPAFILANRNTQNLLAIVRIQYT